jgi:hypothetical protein
MIARRNIVGIPKDTEPSARSLRLGRLLQRGNSSTPHEGENPEGIS